jgi:hypothetical protein
MSRLYESQADLTAQLLGDVLVCSLLLDPLKLGSEIRAISVRWRRQAGGHGHGLQHPVSRSSEEPVR